jgi:hypothetical protein
MGRRDRCADLVRLVRGERGQVAVRMELVIRCEYGSIIPWVRRLEDGRVTAVAGPDRLTLATSVSVHGENLRTVAKFDIKAGDEIPFSLTWSPSYRPVPAPADARDTIEEANAGWLSWSQSHTGEGGRGVVGSSPALADHPEGAEGADPPRDRRHRSGSDDLAARAAASIQALLLASCSACHSTEPGAQWGFA